MIQSLVLFLLFPNVLPHDFFIATHRRYEGPSYPKVRRQNFAFAVNPAHLLKRQKESDGRVRFLNQRDREEGRLRKIIAVRYPNKMPKFEISLRAGMRRSEQCAHINWACIDFQRCDLFVPESKSGQSCHVPLNAPALAVFQALREATGR